MPAEIIRRRHPLAALRLKLRHAQNALPAARDEQPLFIQPQHRAGRFVGRLFRFFCTEDLERRACQLRRRHGPRDEPAHLVDDPLRRLHPVDGRHGFVQHRRIRRLCRVLRRALRRAVFDGAHGVARKICRDVRQPRHQLFRRFHRVDGRFANFNDVALVHPGGQIHRAHARLGAVIEDRPLHGPRPAQLRQDARVHIDAAVLRDVQHALRQNFAVGDHHDQLRRERAQLLHRRVVAERLRLHHRQVMRQRKLLHRRLCQLHPPVFRHIRLGVHRRDLARAAVIQPFEAHAGNVRRAHVNNSHFLSSSISTS